MRSPLVKIALVILLDGACRSMEGLGAAVRRIEHTARPATTCAIHEATGHTKGQ